MKTNKSPTRRAMSFVIAGLFVAGTAHATTSPSKIVRFTAAKPTSVLQTKSTSWRDPAFGDMGWTHNSSWGRFTATKGQTVTISAVSSNPKIHPGLSVWSRGKADTAPNQYVADHFYAQNANQFVLGAKDEETGEVVGNIVMKIAAYGYDQDGNKATVPTLNGQKDGVPGQLDLAFIVKQTGTYMFVLGGFNPNKGVDPAALNDVETTVSITGP